ncbi:MAG: 3-deoxy-7-phosphoheptulonate synthase [Oscillochloris sp.]|nr:3-deoxy-7-phosphoheptulonate synthase [Oscillochloris sp.]
MLVVMAAGATAEQIAAVCAEISAMGFVAHPMPGPTRTAIGITGNRGPIEQAERIARMPAVAELIRVTAPYKLVSREFREAATVVRVAGVPIGGPTVTIIGGPCTVESREQTLAVAHSVAAAGATILRGGAFKPRTSPYAFHGLGETGLQILAEARAATGLPIVTEVLDTETLPLVAEYADMLQIGARNMQNYSLLRAIGRSNKPVLLKRSFAATVQDLLLAAEYLLDAGNTQVVLCERGIRSFDDSSRFTLDLGAVPIIKQLSHLPVIVDPSHASGRWEQVVPMARAAIAAGADGLIVEVHDNPAFAVCDGRQSLVPERFEVMMAQIRRVAAALDRDLTPQP